jgi:PAS domain S-box-containing protein
MMAAGSLTFATPPVDDAQPGADWFFALAETAPQIVWSAPAGGEPDYFNAYWRDLTGMPKGSDGGRLWLEVMHPDDREATVARWRKSLATGDPFAAEFRIRDRVEGGWRWFHGEAWPMREAGAIVRWFGLGVDIEDVVRVREGAARRGHELERLIESRNADLAKAKERVEAQDAVRREEESARRDLDALYAAYIDNTADGVFVVAVEPNAPIVAETVNRVMERALGVRREAIQGRELGHFLPPAMAERLVRQIETCVASGQPLRYEETVELDQVDRVIEVALAPVATEDGRSAHVVGSARDLTERREAEQQLRQAQKMEAVGQLTGGVAHDFNNLLQVVRGNLELLAHELADVLNPAIERRLRDAMAGAERGAKLTRQLLAFSRRQPLTPKPTDVGALIASMQELLQRALGETIEIAIERDPEGWTALVDAAQLENAVLNLAINARDAMPGGGRVAIAVRNVEGDGQDTRDTVEITVADSGSGMVPAVLARVFEPFFSTKPEGRGTGLGLPQVQGFIEQSNGHIEIESAPEKGTTVRLSLPRSAAAAAAEPAAEPADARGRGERILVVEDDDAVRRAAADLLVSLGYDVTAAGTTRDATIALKRDGPFDLMLSDVVMPGQPTPPDLANDARAAHPDLKVLFMSGYAEDVIVHQGRIDADVHLIEKPYGKDDLARKLRELLDRTPAATPRSAPLRVLLVEDEPLIAMSVADMLSAHGYRVVEARNAAAAQAAFNGAEPIDVVLTDLGLPDMDGEDLAQWFRNQRPGVPIVFSTGRDDFQPSPALAEGGRWAVVTKPYDGQTLRDALEACAPPSSKPVAAPRP